MTKSLSNIDLINNTKELIQKAKYELAKVCISQHTISGNVHSFVAYSTLNKNDFPIENAYDKFVLGNYMLYFNEDKSYKLRLLSEEFSWNDDGCKLNVEFTDVIRYQNGGISDLASLVEKVGSLATTANTAKTQADKGVKVSKEFQKIKDEGLQSALSNVLSARNIDVQIDENYMISPYIGGGYLNITSGDKQVVIDPSKSGGEYIFQVKSQGETMVGIKANGEVLFAGEIKTTKGTIGELYAIMNTGKNDLTGEKDTWVEQLAYFDRNSKYDYEPFVNIMFNGTLPDHENIIFDGYIKDLDGKYIGFKYLVRTKTKGFNYSTKWWAIGNNSKNG